MKNYLLKIVQIIGTIKRLLILSIISIWFSGCYGYTVVSKTHYYPPSSDNATAEYSLLIEVHGEKKQAYSANTQKIVKLTIWKKQNKLFSREYTVTAASLEWYVDWEKLEDLNILFFDFSEGNSIYDENALELPAKQILSLRFTYNGQIKSFTEFPVPQIVVQHVKGK